MKNTIVKFISITLFALLVACSATNESTTVTAPTIEKIDIESASSLLAKKGKAVVLDVRTAEEYAAGHIEGAININIRDESFASQVAAKLDKNKTYIVHCAANVKNGRTDKAIKIMSEQGYTNMLDLSGGIAKWMQNGKPVVK